MTKVRMEWTMNEFFDNGGTTAFIDRLCASLGIHASTVKVVGVSQGSVVVNYEITPSEDEPMSIEQIASRQTEAYATGSVDLGQGPGVGIVGVEENGTDTVKDGIVMAAGFPRTILVKTSTNAAGQIYYAWIEPFLWEAAQIASIDTPATIVYEGLWLGLAFLWRNLNAEVADLAEEYAE